MGTHKNSNYNSEQERKKGIRPAHPPKNEKARENFDKHNKVQK